MGAGTLASPRVPAIQSPPSLVGVIVEKPSSCVWSTRRGTRLGAGGKRGIKFEQPVGQETKHEALTDRIREGSDRSAAR